MGKTNKEKGRAPNERKPKKKKTPNINHEPKTKWSKKERAAAIAEYILNGNAYKTARKRGIPESTLRSWIEAAKSGNEEFAKLCESQRTSAFTRAWEIVDLNLSALLARSYITAEMGEEILKIVKMLTSEEHKLSKIERDKLLKQLSGLALPDERSLASTIATMYDKAEHIRTGIDPSAAKFDVNISVLGDEDTSSTASGPPSPQVEGLGENPPVSCADSSRCGSVTAQF